MEPEPTMYLTRKLEMQAFCSISEIDYDYMLAQQGTVCSLKGLCAKQMLFGGLIHINCHDLPQELRDFLIHCAISCGCRTSITNLLNAWRNRLFTFEPPIPLGTWASFVFPPSYTDFEAMHFEISSVLAFIVRCFLSSLISDCDNQSQIQCLDLSAFPMSYQYLQGICCYIIDNCALRENCNKHMVLDETKSSPCTEYVSNKRVIKICCVIRTESELASLLCLLQNIDKGQKYVDFVFTGLHVVCKYVSCQFLFYVLDNLRPETLDAFSCCLSTCDSFEYHEFDVIEKLANFRNLKALNFYMSHLNHSQHSKVICKLRKLVLHLENLKHFSLDQCDLTSWRFREFHVDRSVPLTLCSISGQLERLSITGCKILPEDFEYLSLSPRALVLRTLNLGRSKISLKSFIPLLRACENLHVLRLGRCRFSDGSIDSLFQAFSSMRKLKFLEMKKVHVTSEDLLSQAAYISRMPNLQYLIISPRIQGSGSSGEFLQKFISAVETLQNGSLVCHVTE